jgi:tetratricopeptide (TPR) repeat protein
MKKSKKKEPSGTFHFRVFPEGSPTIWRIMELKETQTLQDLHKTIYQSFGLKGKHLYAFHLSGKRWDSDTEFGGPASGAPKKAIKAELGKLKLEKGNTFLYVYNFVREIWFLVECLENQIALPKVVYPRILESVGMLPEEATPLEDLLPEPLKRWILKFKPVLETWVLTRSKTRGPKDVQEASQQLKEVYDLLKKHGPEIWPLMEEITGMLLVDWLLSLPMDFARRDMTEEALQICDTFSVYADAEYFSSEKALVYAHMGRRERALQQIRENLTRSPENPRIITLAAEAFLKMDEAGHAERLFRKALDLATDDINERERILEKLTAMLEQNERIEEVTELIRSELDRG